MTCKVSVLIVDDDAEESENLANLLNHSGTDLVCTTKRPGGSVEETAHLITEHVGPSADPRLLLLDYRLDDHPSSDETRPDFRGGTIAGYVRDQEPDLPIVLLTSEDKLHQWVERRPGMKQHFDWTLLKSEVAAKDSGASAHARLVDLAQTWRRALGWPQDPKETWTRLGELMGATPEAMDQFASLEPEPPRGDVPGDVLHWLRKRAHFLRGPLINDPAARVMLGVSQASFDSPAVRQWLEPARYDGCLQAFGQRWWSHLVSAQLAEVCDGLRPIEASERVRYLRNALAVDLESETCSWCGGERTLHACMLCRRATDAAHSVIPLGSPLPAWADPEVVCYRCVAEGHAEELRFPPGSQEIVSALVEDRIRPPE
jgi:CheY-like chemotaxis protein